MTEKVRARLAKWAVGTGYSPATVYVVVGYGATGSRPTGVSFGVGQVGPDAALDMRERTGRRPLPSRHGTYIVKVHGDGSTVYASDNLPSGCGAGIDRENPATWPMWGAVVDSILGDDDESDDGDHHESLRHVIGEGDELDRLASEARRAAEAQLRAFGVFATDVSTPPPLPVWRTEPEVVRAEGTAARPFDLSRQFRTMGLVGDDGIDRFPDPAGVLVGVIDTGCDTLNRLLPPDRIRRLSTVPGNPDGSDPTNGHGTSCVGYICGDGQIAGANRYRGVSLGCNVLSVAALTQAGWGTDLMISQAVEIAVKAGCRVVSMSIGGRDKMPLTELAIKGGQDKGVVFVCAAGNSGPGRDTVDYPGRLPGVITVGATGDLDDSGTLAPVADFSSTGPDVDIMAPGVMVPGVHPGGRIVYKSGTSMATPLTAGVFARCLAAAGGKVPGGEPADEWAYSLCQLGGDPRSVPNYGRTYHGFGLIRAGVMIDSAAGGPTPDPEDPPPTTLYLDRDAVEATNRAAIVIADVFAALREHGSVTLRYQPPTQNRKM